MSQKCPLHELQQHIDPAVLNAAADEYADLMLTMCLCMKMAGTTRANIRACALALKQRLVTCHSKQALDSILNSWDPVGQFLSMRREVNTASARYGEPADTFM